MSLMKLRGRKASTLITWVTILRDAGYKTALVGKWDRIGSSPERYGYTKFSGYMGNGCESQSPTTFEVNGEKQFFEGQYTTDVETDHAMNYIREWRNEPWVISLHTWAPHAVHAFPEGYTPPYPDYCPVTGKRNRSWLPLKEEDLAHWKNIQLSVPHYDFPNMFVMFQYLLI